MRMLPDLRIEPKQAAVWGSPKCRRLKRTARGPVSSCCFEARCLKPRNDLDKAEAEGVRSSARRHDPERTMPSPEQPTPPEPPREAGCTNQAMAQDMNEPTPHKKRFHTGYSRLWMQARVAAGGVAACADGADKQTNAATSPPGHRGPERQELLCPPLRGRYGRNIGARVCELSRSVFCSPRAKPRSGAAGCYQVPDTQSTNHAIARACSEIKG